MRKVVELVLTGVISAPKPRTSGSHLDLVDNNQKEIQVVPGIGSGLQSICEYPAPHRDTRTGLQNTLCVTAPISLFAVGLNSFQLQGAARRYGA